MRSMPFIVCAAMLAGCAPAASTSLEEHMRNPLFAEQVAESVVDFLVEMDIQKHPAMEDPAKKAYADALRRAWLERARDARALQREGTSGQFISMGSFAQGEVLYVNDTLYMGPTFEAVITPGTHLYLTTVVDPRDVVFPDPTSLDLGPLHAPYGAQHYAVPKVENPLAYRTAVLWEPTLGFLHSFAQLNQ